MRHRTVTERTVLGTEQPALLELPPEAVSDWRLDERTRVVGRRGVAAARAALARVARAEARGPAAA